MANLTISLDDELLQQAREAAVRDRTSVNALVRDFLTGYVQSQSCRLAAIDALDALAERRQSVSVESWTREELQQRASG
jgi:predicted HicB family RNase H-like nuclease